MTKAMQMKNMQVQKVQDIKADIDARIKMMMELKAQIDAMNEQYKSAQVEFEATYYQLPNDQAEVVEGNEYMATKTPVLTKQEYDVKALQIVLNNSDADASEIISRKVVYVVDKKALKSAIKSGKVAQNLVDQTIHGNQSYRTTMERKA